ncbi:hypothetical protein MHK_006669, partial [Candidatus Magnetomorum sp. HK-1]
MGFHPIFFPKETLFQVFEITMILGAFLGRFQALRALQRPFSIQRWAKAHSRQTKRNVLVSIVRVG